MIALSICHPSGAGVCSDVTARPTGCKELRSYCDSPSEVTRWRSDLLDGPQSPIMYLFFTGVGGGRKGVVTWLRIGAFSAMHL